MTSLSPRSRSGRRHHWMNSSPRSCATCAPGRATRWKSWACRRPPRNCRTGDRMSLEQASPNQPDASLRAPGQVGGEQRGSHPRRRASWWGRPRRPAGGHSPVLRRAASGGEGIGHTGSHGPRARIRLWAHLAVEPARAAFHERHTAQDELVPRWVVARGTQAAEVHEGGERWQPPGRVDLRVAVCMFTGPPPVYQLSANACERRIVVADEQLYEGVDVTGGRARSHRVEQRRIGWRIRGHGPSRLELEWIGQYAHSPGLDTQGPEAVAS